VIDVQGGAGSDRIRTGEANDRISGGGGSDSIDAGVGDDTVSALDGRRDRVSCGDGEDTAAVDSFDMVSGCETMTRRRPARRARKPMR
jgi:Ca2+-binding RTX toxin-like protein